jgi:hypothetical protein
MKVKWGDDEARDVTTIAELDALLDRLSHLERPTIVELFHEKGTTLAIGVGLGDSVVVFFGNDGSSWTAAGNLERKGDSLVFDFCGEPSEFLPTMALACAVARAAVRSFFESGERPNDVVWQGDWGETP